jgi:hypothetical protein
LNLIISIGLFLVKRIIGINVNIKENNNPSKIGTINSKTPSVIMTDAK